VVVISLVGFLLLVAEVLIRWELHSHLRPVRSLDHQIKDFGLAVTDHVKLGKLVSAYIDQRALMLATSQSDLAARGQCGLPIEDVFSELTRVLRLAKRNCNEIRAVASKQLSDYYSDHQAKRYVEENADAAESLKIRRVYVLDKDQEKLTALTSIVGQQGIRFSSNGQGGVRWVYRRSHRSDQRHHGHSVDPDYRADWILFDKVLLIRHDEAGEGEYATVSIDPETIERTANKFDNELWPKGLAPDVLLPASRPKAERVPRALKGLRPRVVGQTGEVA
jgi:hypothetical protein